jgi:LPXTG-motif cell wall-anchored protein
MMKMSAWKQLSKGSNRLLVGGMLVGALLGLSALGAGSASADPSAASTAVPTPAPSATASTAPAVISLSTNGVTWTPTIKNQLFAKFGKIVPGEDVSAFFYARNPTDSAVTMTTRAINLSNSNVAFDNSVTVNGTANGLSLAAPVMFGSLANCATIAPDLILEPNAIAKVNIDLGLLDETGSYAQAASGGFDVLLTMEDNSAGLPTTSCNSADPAEGTTPTIPSGGGGGGTGPIDPPTPPEPTGPSTGTAPTTAHHASTATTASQNPFPLFTAGTRLAFTGVTGQVTLFAAGMLIALGLLLLVARRRRKKSEQES